MADSGGSKSDGAFRAAKSATFVERAGGRLRFHVDLAPGGETTFVSWKKLVKEAAGSSESNDSGTPGKGVEQTSDKPPPLVARPMASSFTKPLAEDKAKGTEEGQAGSNRLIGVMERIERMYAGNGSSNEEDFMLDKMPDEDEYDTDDSFIDDSELDDYFQIDNFTTEHEGFFVHRGKFESIEPAISNKQEPTKTRTDHGGHAKNVNKHMKVKGDKARKESSDTNRNSTLFSQKGTAKNVRGEDSRIQANPANDFEIVSKKRTADSANIKNSSGTLHGKGISLDKYQKTGVASSKHHAGKGNEKNEFHENLKKISAMEISCESAHQAEIPSNNPGDITESTKRKGKGKATELNVPVLKDTMQAEEFPPALRTEFSGVNPGIEVLEKAVKELEKTVAQFRPPPVEIQDPDNSSQGIKRRLPSEIRQKLAKVARLSEAVHGCTPKDLLERLMGIVGHLIQLRTLKGNLKAMVASGFSAQQEKADRVLKAKKEIQEIIKISFPFMNFEMEQQFANPECFKESGLDLNLPLETQYSMDEVLEDKIRELHEIYVETMDEDSELPVQIAYEELASLWPCGVMDGEGIMRGVARAKERRQLSVLHKAQDQTTGKESGAAEARLVPEAKLKIKRVLNALASCPAPLVDGLKHGDQIRERISQRTSYNLLEGETPVDVQPRKRMRAETNSEVDEALTRTRFLTQTDKVHSSG